MDCDRRLIDKTEIRGVGFVLSLVIRCNDVSLVRFEWLSV